MVIRAGLIIVVAVALSGVAGCVGNAAGSAGPTTKVPTTGISATSLGGRAGGGNSAQPPPSGGPGLIAAQSIAQSAGCQDVRLTTMQGTSDAVHCFIGSASVDVATFASIADRDQFVSLLPTADAVTVGVASDGKAWAAMATGAGAMASLAGFRGSQVPPGASS